MGFVQFEKETLVFDEGEGVKEKGDFFEGTVKLVWSCTLKYLISDVEKYGEDFPKMVQDETKKHMEAAFRGEK